MNSKTTVKEALDIAAYCLGIAFLTQNFLVPSPSAALIISACAYIAYYKIKNTKITIEQRLYD